MNAKRKIFIILVLWGSLLASLSAQQTAHTKAEEMQKVKIRFRNNSIVFRKVTIVTYFPIDLGGNSTEGMVLMPYSSTTKIYKVGTKIYLANSTQVDTVMNGKKLGGTPFLVVKAEDEGKTFNIFK